MTWHNQLDLCSAPQVIIYDNGCNLHNYCLNREPLFFKNSWFLVDRFHWPNHSGGCFLMHLPKPNCFKFFFFLLACSVGYNLSSYPQFSAVNSQVVEQSNSLLKRIRSTVSYMSATNFVNHCALFFWYHNKTKSTWLYEVTCIDHWFCPVL